MTTRAKFGMAGAALLAAFLLGFVPQYQTSGSLRQQLKAARDEADSLRRKLELAELRDLAALTWMETSAKNYGLARELSSRFFTRAGEVAAASAEEPLRVLLREIYSERDRITAALVEGQGGAQAEVEKIVRRLYEAKAN